MKNTRRILLFLTLCQLAQLKNTFSQNNQITLKNGVNYSLKLFGKNVISRSAKLTQFINFLFAKITKLFHHKHKFLNKMHYFFTIRIV